MKILLTVDPEIPVPPEGYGGIERIVASLISEYRRLGHKIYLIANSSSKIDVDKLVGWKGQSSISKYDTFKNSIQLFKTIKKIQPDVIHSFSRLLYLYPAFFFSKTKVLQTYQRRISKYSTGMANKIAKEKINYTSCSAYMHKGFEHPEKWHTVYNFTDTNYFVPNENIKKEFLMFLGRIEDIKGTKEAIDVALATNNKLIIAGNIQEGHDTYFNTKIKPYLTHPLIEYVGEVNDEQKKYYLSQSKAFLFPIKWEEPFGIVMAEAMACGTPVIGFNRGSVPEVVVNGKTGFVVENISQMIDAVNKIDEIDRVEVRKYCEENFSLTAIAKQYLQLYNKILNYD